MSKKISQLQTSSGTDDSTFIPIIMGEPKVNRKISSKNLISPTDDPINEIISDLSDLAYTKDLDIESDVIGYLEYNSPAPTPNENGKFEFIVGGFCSWLDSVVFVNDQVLVTKLETYPVTYEYTHIKVVENYATPLDVEEAVSSLNLKYDSAFVENGLLYFTIDGNIVGRGIEVGSSSTGAENITTVIGRVSSGYSSSFAVPVGTENQPTSAILHYTFTSIYNDTLESTGEQNQAVIYVGGFQVGTQIVPQGNNTFDVGPYLSNGTNRVVVSITDANGIYRNIQYTVTVVAISISSTFKDSMVYTDSVTFKYTPIGKESKTIYFELDGVIISTVTTSESGSVLTQILPAQEHGGHTLNVYAQAIVNGITVTSDVLHYEIIWAEAGNTTPIIVSSFNKTEIEQYSTINIPYIVYDPMHAESTVKYLVNGTLIATLSGVTSDQQTWSYRTSISGNTVMRIECGEMFKEFNVLVKGSSITSEATTNDLELYLTSSGKSNYGVDRDVWVYNGISTITANLTNFNYTSDGWLIDSNGNTFLRVAGDARVEIPFKIFDRDFKENGKTIEFEFATRNITNYNSIAISSINNNQGIKISTQTASLSSQLLTTSTKFKEDDRVRVSFVVEKKTENRIIYTYINGIMSGASIYKDTDNFRQSTPTNIIIGSNGCTVDVYNIRIYNNNLTNYQILNNYIYDMDDINKKVSLFTRNKLLDDSNNLIYGNVLEQIPCMLITGSLPQYKGDKQTVDIRYDDLQNPENSFTLKGIYDNLHKNIDVQGTSSQYYPRKNYKLSLNKGELYDSKNILTNGKYKLREDSVEAKYFTVKADFAESSGAHNTGLAKLGENTFKKMSVLTPPQKKQFDLATGTTVEKLQKVNVRTTVDGFPIAIFHRTTEFDNITFLGKYNFNIDKGSVEVFGFTNSYPSCECWEFLNNTSPRALFRSTDFTSTFVNDKGETNFTWTQDFEARYPDTDPAYSDVTNLSKLFSWIDSCNPEKSSNETFNEPITFNETNISGEIIYYSSDNSSYRLAKFKNEAHEHFNVENLLSYYLFTEIFGMVDQRAKNMFLTSWGNEGSGEYKWYFVLYDNDTALGINNEGANVFSYNIEYHDRVDKNNPSSAKVWNGESSLLWYLVETSFIGDIQQMYYDLRSFDYLSYDKALNVLNNEQSDKWAEEIYNADGKFKYIEPYTIGYYDSESDSYIKTDSFLYALQGSRNEHRKWWLYNRFKYLDSKYTAGDYESDFATMRLYTPSGETTSYVEPNPNFVLTPISDQYCKVKYGSYISTKRSYAEENVEMIPNVPIGTTFNDTETIIYGISRIKDLGDLSNKYLGTVDLTNATKLERLIVGSPIEGYNNPNLGGDKVLGQNQMFSVGSSQLLKIVDIRNCSGLVDPLDVSKCLNIEEIYAKGSSISSVTLANSGNLKILQLPDTITSLTIKNQPLLSTGFTIDSVNKLKSINIEKVPNIDLFNLISRCASAGVLENINIIGLYGTTSDVNSLKYLVNLYGNVTGNIIVENITDSDWLLLTNRFPELVINKLVLFEDLNVEQIVKNNWDENNDNLIYSGELKDIQSLNGVFMNQTGITSFNELRYFLSIYSLTDDFSGCTNLSQITLPTRVTTIGNDAFNGFTSLTSVIYPSSLVTIGDRVFNNCINLSGQLNLQGNLRTIGAQAFKNCHNISGSLLFPNEIRNISNESFYSCTGLNGNLNFSSNLLTVGDSAFYNCSNLSGSLTFPITTVGIGDSSFYGCSSFNGNLTLGKNINNIGEFAFENCTGFTGSLLIPSGVASIKNGTFLNCSGFNGTLTLPSKLTSIGESAFENCTGFTGSLLIPSGVTSIGNNAFNNDKFTSLFLSNNLTTIGNNAFKNCNLMVGTLTLPSKLTSIGESAFENCTGFTGSLLIPSGVTSIGNKSFYNCNKLSGKLTIQNSEVIGQSSFEHCNNITEIKLSDNLTSIESFAFKNCSNVRGSIEIPSGVTSIGEQAFYGVINLSSIVMNTLTPPVAGEGIFDGSNCDIVIPTGSYNAYTNSPVWSGYTERYIEAYGFSDDEVERILVENWDVINVNGVIDPEEAWAITAFTNSEGVNVFQNNTLIKVFNEMVQFTGLTRINDYEFSGCVNLNSLKLPNNITSIGDRAFSNCSSLTREMTFSDSIINIGEYSFYNCTMLPGIIKLPNQLTIIKTSTFENCHNIDGIEFNPNLHTIQERAFYMCYGIHGNIKTPESLTSIGSSAFQGCSGINGVLTINKNVTNIGNDAFNGCTGISNIVIKSIIPPIIGNNVFNGSVCDIYVPITSLNLYLTGETWVNYSNRIKPYINFTDDKVELVAITSEWDYNNDDVLSKNEAENIITLNNKYKNNTNIKSFNELAYFTGLTKIDVDDFNGCNNLINIELPNTITEIGSNAFSDCQNITSNIPSLNNLTTIGGRAFYNCHSISGDFYKSPNINVIGSHAFSGCNNITGDLIIPTNVTEIKDFVYYSCTGLNGQLYFSPNLTKIGISSFENCRQLIGDLIIPETVNSVGLMAFKNCYGLDGELIISSNLNTISKETFAGCKKITGTIEIPLNVTNIEFGAFSGCSGYNKLIINENVSSIGDFAFNGNSSLNTIIIKRYVPPTITSSQVFGNTNNCPIYIPVGSLNAYKSDIYWGTYTSRYVEYMVFEDPITKDIALSLYDTNGDGMLFNNEIAAVNDISSNFNVTGITSFDELQYFTGITSISSSAFINNDTLKSIVIPETITEISFRAFSDCIALTKFNFPRGLLNILDHAFYGCTSLTGYLDFPDSMVNLGSYTFQKCSSITGFIFRNDNPPILGAGIFQDVGNGPVYVPYGTLNKYLTASGWGQIQQSRFIEYIKFKDYEVSRILENSIYYLDNNPVITDNELNGVSTLNNLFYNNNKIETFNELSGFTNITILDSNEFSGCSNLSKITLPINLISIGVNAFKNCVNLSGNISIPNSVVEIKNSAFYGCSSLTGLNLPANLTVLGDNAFNRCNNLTGDIIIPTGITEIGNGLCNECYNITGLTLHDKVSLINPYAFANCTNLTSIVVYAPNPPVITDDVFVGINANCKIRVPSSSLSQYQDSWSTYSNMIISI